MPVRSPLLIEDQVGAGEVHRQHGMLHLIDRAIRPKRVQHLGWEALIGGDAVGAGDVDAGLVRGSLRVHAEPGDES